MFLGVNHAPVTRGPASTFYATSYNRVCQLKQKLYRVNHTPTPRDHTPVFATRNLFAVANLLVLILGLLRPYVSHLQ